MKELKMEIAKGQHQERVETVRKNLSLFCLRNKH